MDNATSYVQFYTNSHIGNELLYPVSCSFVNACLFPISFNFTTKDELLGRLTFFGFEQRNAILTGNILLFQKAEKNILSILNSQLNMIDNHLATLNKEMFDFTVAENQLVLYNIFGEYTKHKQAQIIKGAAPTQQSKLITIGQLQSATIQRIQNIVIHDRNLYLDDKHIMSYLERLSEMSSIHEAIVSSHKLYKSDTVKYLNMLKELSIGYEKYIYNSESYTFNSEHKIYMSNIDTLNSEHEIRLGSILQQNTRVKESIGQLFSELKKVKGSQFNMSLLSNDIFSDDNVRVFYSSLINTYEKNKETIMSPILKFNLDDRSNVSIFFNSLETTEHVEKYFGDSGTLDGYLKDLRNYQNIKFELQMSKTARMSTINNLIKQTDGSKNRSITLDYILSISSLAKAFSIPNGTESFGKQVKSFDVIQENYHIEKNSKDLFYEDFYYLFDTIRKYGGTIRGIKQVDIIRKNEATIVDNFNVFDKQPKDLLKRYTFSDFIIKQQKSIKTTSSKTLYKDKIFTTNSNIHNILSKETKSFVRYNSNIKFNKELNLLCISDSLIRIVTKEQKKIYKFINGTISKQTKQTEKDIDFMQVTRPQVKESTSTIHLIYENGTVRNTTLPEFRNDTVARNLTFSVLNDPLQIGKNQKGISNRNKWKLIEKNQKEISDKNKLSSIEKDTKELDTVKEIISVSRPTQYEAWILHPGELASVLSREVNIVKNILGASTNERFGEVDSRIVLVEKNKETTTLFDIYFALQKNDKTILINLNQTIDHAEHIVTALDEYKRIEKQLKEVYNSVMEKFDSIEKEIVLSEEYQVEKPSKDIDIFSLPILEHIKYFDMHRLKPLQKSQKHVIISSKGSNSFTRMNEILLIDKFIYTEMYRRWYFLPEDGENDGPYDWMILPMDFPYAQHPEYNIKEHPIIDGGAQALNEIPVSVKKVEDVIEFCFQLWESHLDLYSRYTPEQAVKHFVNLIYEWLTKYLPEMIYKMPKSYPDNYGWKYNDYSYREEYWRIYRWIRWYAEAIIINVKEQDKKNLIGNVYVSKLVNDLVKYFNDHHGKYGMPDVPESSIINKVKGKRHKWLSNNFNKGR